MKQVRFAVVMSLIILLSLSLCYGAEGPPASPGPADEATPKHMPPPPPPFPAMVKSPAGPAEQPPVLEKLAPGLFRFGDITIHKKSASLSFPAVINMDKGLLEYLLVSKSGKTHESLLSTTVEPYHIHLACLLLGWEGTSKPLPFQGAAETPKGDSVVITFSILDKNGKPTKVEPADWIVKQIDNKTVVPDILSWVFTGSMIHGGRFMAQTSGSVIALYHDPVAIFDNTSPGGDDDRIWFVNQQNIPEVGTPVTITIQAVP